MKKLFLLTLTCVLSATLAWAADGTIVENYGTAPTGGVKTLRSSYEGCYSQWYYRNARSKTSDKLIDNTRSFWLSRASGNSCYLESTLEGGIKAIAFKWRQFAGGATDNDNGYLFVLNVNIDGVKADDIKFTGAESYATSDNSYSKTLAVKSNAKLTLQNQSTQSDGTTAGGRLIVGPITITPYIYYTQREVSIGLKQKGYVNRELIDNTGNEGSVSYSSNAEEVATVDSETGVITPVSEGEATITATWTEGATTTYKLKVLGGTEDVLVENFSKVKQTSASSPTTPWDGDLFSWEHSSARRAATDTIGIAPRKQATWLSKDAYIESSAVVEGGIKNISFTWRQWSAKAASTTTKVAVNYGGEVKAYQEFEELEANDNKSFNKDIDGGNANAVLRISNLSYNEIGTVNNRIVIENVKITPYLLYTTKDVTWDRTANDGESYTNNDLIDNTSGEAVAYSISVNTIGATINTSSGAVSATGGGDVVVTATWGDVTTSYNLHIKANTSITCPAAEKRVGLTEEWSNAFTVTPSIAPVVYASSNTSVATINATGAVTIVGVGQTTISATINESENYGASSASYTLYVTDNSASVQVETFSKVSNGGVDTHAGKLWHGDVYDWRVSTCGGVRKNNDAFASNPERSGIWMGTPNPNVNYSSLTVENGVEGGIKHLWFYCEQPKGTSETGYTLKPVVYLNSVAPGNKVAEVEVVGATDDDDIIASNRKLLGASNVTKSNSVLIIRNESFKTSDGTRPVADESKIRGRFLLDEIHITPWLLYTNKSVSIVNSGTYINEGLVNNTGGETGTLSYRSLNESVATVEKDGSGKCVVTPRQKGVATIEAKFDWGGGNYVTTTYQLHVVDALTWTEDYSNFPSRGMQESKITDKGVYLDWYYRYARSNPSKDKIDGNRGVWTNHYNRNTVTNKATYLGCETEGGIKHAYFKWRQATTDDNTDNLYLSVAIDGVEKFDRKVTASDTYVNTPQEFNEDFEVKTNADFRILNISTTARENPTDIGRMIIGPVTITPYLFYLEREKTIESGVNYTHPMIDNMDGEGYVTYSLVNPTSEGIATIDEETGEVTAISQGSVTVKATWSEGAFTTYTLHIVDVILNDNADNQPTITSHNGQAVGVQLLGRTLKTGGYNTLCLPFALDEEQIAASSIADATIYDFTTAYLSSDVLDVRFTKVTEMEARKPYLVVVPEDKANPVFTDVTIENGDPKTVEGGSLNFIGVISPTEIPTTSLFVVGNELYRAGNASSRNMNALRAYFDVPSGEPALSPKIRMRIVAGKNTATDIESVQQSAASCQKVLRDGQLLIIRDGKTYNAQGLLITNEGMKE